MLEYVVDELICWFDVGVSDGFILGFVVQCEGLDDFVIQVLLILQVCGYYQCELEGQILCDYLGLLYKVSCYVIDVELVWKVG